MHVRDDMTAPLAGAEHHDRRRDTVIAAINACGEAYFSGTAWRAMRFRVVNWRTSSADIDRALAAAKIASERCTATRALNLSRRCFCP